MSCEPTTGAPGRRFPGGPSRAVLDPHGARADHRPLQFFTAIIGLHYAHRLDLRAPNDSLQSTHGAQETMALTTVLDLAGPRARH